MKKVIVTFDKQDSDILVQLSQESASPEEVFDFLQLNLYTFSQKKLYNTKVKNILKEYLINMATCAEAIEKNNELWELKFSKNNELWMQKIEQQRVDFENRSAEFEHQRLEFQHQRIEFEQKFEDQKNELQLLQRTLIDNGIQISKK